MVDFFTDKTL
ncbi:hypothetical protein VCCP103710_3369, partial [Vibrio cholerae CP1037(10)]